MRLNRAKSYGEYVTAADAAFRAVLKRARKGYRAAPVAIQGATAAIEMPDARDVRLVLPAWPMDRKLSRARLDKLTALWMHELCHALYTDADAWREACNGGLGKIVNGMEDARIEAAAMENKIFRDLGHSMHEIFAVLAEENGQAEKAFAFDPNDPRALPLVLAFVGRAHLGNSHFDDLAKRIVSELQPQMRDLVMQTVTKLAEAETTADVLAIARDLADGEQGEGQPDQGEEGEGQPGEGDEGQPGEGDEGQPGEGDEGQPGKGDEGQPGGPSNVGLGDAIRDDNAESAEAETPDAGDTIPEEKIQGWGPQVTHDEAEAARDALRRGGAFEKGDIRSGATDKRMQAERLAAQGNTAYQEIVDRADRSLRDLPKSALVRETFRRAMLAEDRSDVLRGERRGRFDRSKLAKFRTGAPGVMKRRHEEPGETAAVLILLDCSWSMDDNDQGAPLSENRLNVAAAMAYAAAGAVERAGGKVEIWAFGGEKDPALCPIKKHRDPLAKAERALADYILSEGIGGTPYLGAVMLAAQRLGEFGAGQDRRLLIPLADGACYNTHLTAILREHVAAGGAPAGVLKQAGEVADAIERTFHGYLRDALARADADALGIRLGDDMAAREVNVPMLPPEFPCVETRGGKAEVVRDVLAALAKVARGVTA